LIKLKGREGKKRNSGRGINYDENLDAVLHPYLELGEGRDAYNSSLSLTLEETAKTETISVREVTSDVLKWLTYDLLSEAALGGNSGFQGWEKGLLSFFLGGASSIVPSFIKHPWTVGVEAGMTTEPLGVENAKSNDTTISNSTPFIPPSSPLSFLWKESLEGAFLFFSYEEIQDIITKTEILDDLLDKKFVFEELVEELENMI